MRTSSYGDRKKPEREHAIGFGVGGRGGWGAARLGATFTFLLGRRVGGLLTNLHDPGNVEFIVDRILCEAAATVATGAAPKIASEFGGGQTTL